MKRLFITGMSGTGKSSVIEALQARGFEAVDTDYGDWCEEAVIDGEPDWVWREDKMRELFARPRSAQLFVSGCRSNQKRFYPYFDYKILLNAPLDVILERVTNRANNPYGKTNAERADICRYYETVLPSLRKSADIEIDTAAMNVGEVTDYLIELALNKS